MLASGTWTTIRATKNPATTTTPTENGKRRRSAKGSVIANIDATTTTVKPWLNAGSFGGSSA